MHRMVRMVGAVRARLHDLLDRGRAVGKDAGMVTSEYAMGIVAAVAFAVVLYKVVTSGPVGEALTKIVQQALDGDM